MHLAVSRSHLTPLAFLDRAGKVFSGKTAVVEGDRHVSYGEFRSRAIKLAAALQKAGIQKGDRVAVLAPNSIPVLEAHFGVPMAGAVLVCINTRLAPSEIAYILNHSGSRFLLVDVELSGLIEPVREQLKSVQKIIDLSPLPSGPRIGSTDYESFLESAEGAAPILSMSDENESISINYTSGTTGKPKGVMYSHRGAYLNAVANAVEAGLSPDSVYLWTLPMFHCNGWCYPWAVTAVGGTHVCLRKFDPGAAWKLIAEHNVSHYCGAPVVHVAMLNHPDRPGQLRRPLTVPVGGAPPSPTLMEQMEKIGGRFLHIYGLTETYGPYTTTPVQPDWKELPAAEKARKMARQGFNHLLADDVRVVDEQMNDVPCDGRTMGEVVMRGNIVMLGYYNDPEATDKAFRGGWFHSGDLAVRHPDGYVELRDRGKDIIISGGENISSIEVEQALCRHPAVLEVAVIGVPHEKWGESPKAFITLKSGQSVTAPEIISFCREQLAHFKCPTAVEFTALPKTSTGKVQKYVLREKEWKGQTVRIKGA